MPTTTETTVPLVELANEMGVPKDVALDLARRAGAKTFGRSWKGEQLVPSKIAEKTLANRKAEIEAADRLRLEHDAEHKAWLAAREAERRRVFQAEARQFSAAERAGEAERYTYFGWTTVGATSLPISGRAAAVASQRTARHMQDWLKRNPEPSL